MISSKRRKPKGFSEQLREGCWKTRVEHGSKRKKGLGTKRKRFWHCMCKEMCFVMLFLKFSMQKDQTSPNLPQLADRPVFVADWPLRWPTTLPSGWQVPSVPSECFQTVLSPWFSRKCKKSPLFSSKCFCGSFNSCFRCVTHRQPA